LALLGLIPAAFATSAMAQTDPHAGHHMPVQQAADPHAGHHAPAQQPAPDPHAGHAMPPAPAASVSPHAGHAPPDPHAGHGAMTGADLPVGEAPPPAPPSAPAADRIFGAAEMERARDVLRLEHGGMRHPKTMLDTFELRPDADGDAYAWEGEFRYGGDVNRFVFKTEGEGEVDHGLEAAEVQALYSRAIGPYFDIQAGLRHDFEPGPSRTYATIGFEGLAPYWFEVEGAAFLSEKGDLSARLEGAYDLRLTQRLILEPRAEIGLSAQDVPELDLGSGVTDAEIGLRLRYEIRREFAPYVGVVHERRFGETADLARAAGEPTRDTRFVIGVRAWF
jgi:copper resistance protein B